MKVVKEIKEIKQSMYLYSDIENEVVRQRIQNSLNWYIRKAVVNKRLYYIFSSISVILPLLATIMYSIDIEIFLKDNLQIYSALLACATTMTTSGLSLFRFRDYWKEYRQTAEKIKAELFHYHMGLDKYMDHNIQDLASAFETILVNSSKKQKEIIDSTSDINASIRTTSNKEKEEK